MANIISGLNMDRGVQIEGLLDSTSVRHLADYVLANFVTGIHKERHYVPVLGDLYGYRASKLGNYSPDAKLKLNTAPVIGRFLINNSREQASLGLFADLNDDLAQKESASLRIKSLGRMIFERVDVYKKYESVMSALDLDDSFIWTELQPDKRVMLYTELGLEI